ncbi:hypothetical protein JCM8097_009397 [Rhodosporidiobolus ruineniae]
MSSSSSPAAPALLGTASVPYAPVAPSPSALSISPDGQYAILTRGEINLFTPALGFATTPGTSTTSGGPAPGGGGAAQGKGKERAREELPLLRTVIPVEKKNVVKWHQWVDEYDAVVPGANDAWWRSASWSPSGLSALGGCILATLTTNAEVLLFAPGKDAIKGEWSEICDVTALLLAAQGPKVDEVDQQTPQMRREVLASLRRCQTSSLSWSPAVPNGTADYSLLALGSRSGEVTLWRLTPEKDTLELVLRFRPEGDVNWINLLSWSSWTVTSSDETRKASATLALADADGRVWSVEVSQTLFGAGMAEVEAAPAVPIASKDGRCATQLCWIDREPTQRQLAYSKLGTVSVATLRPDLEAEEKWTVESDVEVELRTEGAAEWMGATAWAPCSGLAYIPHSDSLLVSLSSSSLHLLTLSPSPSYSPSSANLTSSARTLFQTVLARGRGQTERFPEPGKGDMSRKMGARGTGFVGLGGGREGMNVAYIYETERPAAFTHRTATGIHTHLTIANLVGDDPSAEELVKELEELLGASMDARAQAPLARLQPFLNRLTNLSHSSDLLDAVLPHLEALPFPPSPPSATADKQETGLPDRLSERLFGDEALEAVRVKEIVARVLSKQKNLPQEYQHAVVVAHVGLARQLIKEVLTRIADTLGAAKLSAADKPIHALLSLAASSLLPPASSSSSSGEDAPLLPPDALADAFPQPDDRCPACKAEVPLANVRYACCVQGHQWERCSLTLALVATVHVRTCTGCERKALIRLPSSPTSAFASNGSEGAEGEKEENAVDQLLRAATCCAYCGGRWMRVR